MRIWCGELGRENNNCDCLNYSYTRWARLVQELSLHSQQRIWAKDQYLVCSAGLQCSRDPALPWFEPTDGARLFQTFSLTWHLCLWKRTSSHQTTALGWMSLSLQCITRVPSCAEGNHLPTSCIHHLQTLLMWMDLSAHLICSLLNLPFSPSSPVDFQGYISLINLSFPYPAWVQPALLLTGHTHNPVPSPKLNYTCWTKLHTQRPWARGFLCLLFPSISSLWNLRLELRKLQRPLQTCLVFIIHQMLKEWFYAECT